MLKIGLLRLDRDPGNNQIALPDLVQVHRIAVAVKELPGNLDAVALLRQIGRVERPLLFR